MRKFAKILTFCLVACLCLTMLSACGGSSHDGEYKSVKVAAFGQEMSAEEVDLNMVLSIDGDKITLTEPGNEEEELKGTIAWEEGVGTITLDLDETQQSQLDELGMDINLTLTEEENYLVMDLMGFMKVYFEKQ